MDKIAKVPHLREELDWLDQTYGVEKEGFFHQEHWQLLVAIMLSAQSTDKQVDEVLPKLYGRFPTVQEIAQATEEEIGEEIKSVGLYKSKAKHVKSCCMQLAEQYGGEVPTTIEELVKLAGVGRKTATLFLADAYGIPGVTVDTHVFRISHRLGWANGKNPVETEEELMRVHSSFTVASALMSGKALEQALMYPKQGVELDMTFRNVMSVNVPIYHYMTRTDDAGDIFPYGFAATSGELDGAVAALGEVFQSMLQLAQIEKTAQLMAEEIEKTRRRVNALEYVVSPQTEEAIRYISMKLDENDRATTTRLMKVKDMLLKEAIEDRRAEDARAARVFGSSGEAPQQV